MRIKASISEINKDQYQTVYQYCRSDCRLIQNISSVHQIEIAAPFEILTKKEYYSEKTLMHHFFNYPVVRNKIIQKDCQGTKDQQCTPEDGKYYVVEYEEGLFPGVVTEIHCGRSVQVNCLQKATTPAGSIWK